MYAYGYFNSFNLLGGVSLDPDAQAFITAASITDPTQQAAVNQLVIDFKAASLWTKGSVINPYIGGTATAHRYNLKTALTDTAWFGGITHDSNGVTFNGTNGYGQIEFLMTVANRYNRSVFRYYKEATTATGWTGADAYFGFQANRNPYSSNKFWLSADGLNRLTGQNLELSFGMVGASIIASNDAKIYNNTTVKASTTTPGTNPSDNRKMWTGGLNSSGLYGGETIAFEFYGDGLTSTDVSNLVAAVQTFQTTLGRNV